MARSAPRRRWPPVRRRRRRGPGRRFGHGAVREAWEAVGAKVRLVGSLATGLMTAHRDIDFHLYTETLSPEAGFAVMGRLRPLRLTFQDLSGTPERCLEWHAWLADPRGDMWQADMIQMPFGSPWEGFFERRDARIRAVLTPETRHAILALKAALPASPHVPGLHVTLAVLRDGVRTLEGFRAWQSGYAPDGVERWRP